MKVNKFKKNPVGNKVDITLLEYAIKTNFFWPTSLYLYMRSISCNSAGYLLNDYELNDFVVSKGISKRKLNVMLRSLRKRGWIMRLGDAWHVSSIDRIKNQITISYPEYATRRSERITTREILKPHELFLANCVELISAKLIEARNRWLQKNDRSYRRSAYSGADNSYGRDYNFGDCSFRLKHKYTGLSLSYLHKLSKIQEPNKYHKRYCKDFDDLNVTSLSDLHEHIKAEQSYGNNICASMFEYCRVMTVLPFVKKPIYSVVKRYRRRLSDWIAVSVDLTTRRSNKKDRKKTIDGLLRLLPNTKRGVNDFNNISSFLYMCKEEYYAPLLS